MSHEIFKAITAKDFGKVKKIIEDKINIQIRDAKGYTPLFYACRDGHFEIAKLLIDNGADVNTKDNNIENWYTPLTWACENGHFEIVKLLVDNGADVNIVENFYTPLVSAAGENYFEIVKFLIENGADVKSKSLALIETSDLEIAKFLIENGADVNAKDDEGNTALCRTGHLEIAEFLIENGADVNVKNDEGYTALELAINYDFIDIANFLITECGAKFNPENYGDEILARAIEYKETDLAKLLIENGMSVNSKNSYNKRTPLIDACYYGNFEIVKLLIEKGANMNTQDIHGQTALMMAYEGSHSVGDDDTDKENYFNIIKLLIDNGANIHIKDNDGEKFLDKLSDPYVEEKVRKYLKSKKSPKPLNIKLPSGVTCFDEIEYSDVLIKDFVKSYDNILIKIGNNIKGYNRTDIIEYYNKKKTLYSSEKLFPGDVEKLKNKKYLFYSTVDTGNNVFVLVPQTMEKFFS